MRENRWGRATVACALVLGIAVAAAPAAGASGRGDFRVEEATIEEIQSAILRRKVTTTEIVERYLERIKAYNGPCVNQPEGILGPISTIPHAGKLNALITLNLRPDTREAWGFDERKARSMTDAADDDPDMPDALEVAAAHLRRGRLLGQRPPAG
jgi:amidase